MGPLRGLVLFRAMTCKCHPSLNNAARTKPGLVAEVTTETLAYVLGAACRVLIAVEAGGAAEQVQTPMQQIKAPAIQDSSARVQATVPHEPSRHTGDSGAGAAVGVVDTCSEQWLEHLSSLRVAQPLRDLLAGF